MRASLTKASLLSLSFMLVSTFAVSPALPQMLSYYQTLGYSASQVELLFSLSSFAILGMVILTPWFSRLLSERLTLILGLSLLALGGSLPVFFQAYSLVFASRLVLGIGIGLINARAITIIGERFAGKERIQMLGLRGSTEVLGSAVLTFLVGQLLRLSWSASFAIYLLALPILFFYLILVPKTEVVEAKEEEPVTKTRLNAKELWWIFGLASFAGFVILVNSANTLRIPILVDEFGLGTASQASFILSLMMLMGILSGLLFSNIIAHLRHYIMQMVSLILGLGLVMIYLADDLLFLGVGALLTGFVYSLGVTFVFHRVSETLQPDKLNTATTLVLLGCNLGGGGASIVLSWFAQLLPGTRSAFLIFAGMSFTLAIILSLRKFFQTRGL